MASLLFNDNKYILTRNASLVFDLRGHLVASLGLTLRNCGPVTRYGAEVSALGPDQNIALWVVMLK